MNTETSIDEIVQQERNPSVEFEEPEVPDRMVMAHDLPDPQNRPYPSEVKKGRLSSIKEYMGEKIDFKSALIFFVLAVIMLSKYPEEFIKGYELLMKPTNAGLTIGGIVVFAVFYTLVFMVSTYMTK